MPVANVEAPDGRTITIEHPEGATDEQILQQAAILYNQETQQKQPPKPSLSEMLQAGLSQFSGLSEEEKRAAFEQSLNVGDPSALIGIGRGLTDFGEGVKQTALELGVNADLASQQELDQFNADALEERQFFAGTEVGQSARGGAGRIVGNVAPLAPAVPAGLLPTMLVGGAQGATQFAQTPGKRMQNTALGVVLPAAIRGTGAAISETIRRAARGGEAGRRTLQETIDTFADVGASPTLGQGTGLRHLLGSEKVLKSLPGSGGTIEAAAARTAAALSSRAAALSDKMSRGATAESAGRSI